MLKKRAERKTDTSDVANAVVDESKIAIARIEKDLEQLRDDPINKNIKVIPDPKTPFIYTAEYSPTEGYWQGGTFQFRVEIPTNFPYAPPSIKYIGPKRVWHPNIESDADKTEWGVCISIKRDDWFPTLGLREFFFGIYVLFHEPNVDDCLPGDCKKAADMLRSDKKKFQETVRRFIQGNYQI